MRSFIDGISGGGRAGALLVRTAPRPVSERGIPGRAPFRGGARGRRTRRSGDRRRHANRVWAYLACVAATWYGELTPFRRHGEDPALQGRFRPGWEFVSESAWQRSAGDSLGFSFRDHPPRGAWSCLGVPLRLLSLPGDPQVTRVGAKSVMRPRRSRGREVAVPPCRPAPPRLGRD